MSQSSSDAQDLPLKVLLSHEEIRARVVQLGKEIASDYFGKNPVFICVLRGSVYFFSDLTRRIPYPIEVDFLQAKSYIGKDSNGKVELIKDLDSDITDRHVIIVEDIVDTGHTLKFLIRHILARNPSSLEIVSLLFKEGAETVEYPVKYIGWKIGKEFVVGYGLDFDGKFRNLPDIHILED
ncbi:hypoxanthine phosphoribosyltransferase [Leptospira inadai serovar Lyme str. 10]|uniref:Hypoxanthine phosphoribosyltransferase n=2 Tax=Leptospira inadai serovar Lyme TaxID=293084 RepID=V6H9R4_9LEPT|nr:hypoxanthine phosphoribosyltransferase [Leptospira inadai]EQA34938.1 hypoxanthine phosphoribosyltransferase [Leptospira inadai serovar Lyme str. 10]PNV75382.1 hypoxanthine phosphoribosyltransferase [Leptospira inadai serovar Lyme]